MDIEEMEKKIKELIGKMRWWHWLALWLVAIVFFPVALIALGSYVLLRPALNGIPPNPAGEDEESDEK